MICSIGHSHFIWFPKCQFIHASSALVVTLLLLSFPIVAHTLEYLSLVYTQTSHNAGLGRWRVLPNFGHGQRLHAITDHTRIVASCFACIAQCWEIGFRGAFIAVMARNAWRCGVSSGGWSVPMYSSRSGGCSTRRYRHSKTANLHFFLAIIFIIDYYWPIGD